MIVFNMCSNMILLESTVEIMGIQTKSCLDSLRRRRGLRIDPCDTTQEAVVAEKLVSKFIKNN